MTLTKAKASAARILRAQIGRLKPDLIETALYRSLLKHHFKDLFKSRRIERREEVWDYAMNTIGRDRKVLLLEFGVHEGYSLAYFAKGLSNPQAHLVGFDLFEGLPEVWGSKPAGKFSTSGALPAIADPRVSFVKGWFQDTLPDFDVPAGDFEAVLVHLDADLYSSTLFVLSQLWRTLDSFHAIFDEFSGHETRALYNFTSAFPCTVTFLAYDYPFPNRVLCRIDVKRAARDLRQAEPSKQDQSRR